MEWLIILLILLLLLGGGGLHLVGGVAFGLIDLVVLVLVVACIVWLIRAIGGRRL